MQGLAIAHCLNSYKLNSNGAHVDCYLPFIVCIPSLD
jgi:hypothetical protein